MTDRPILFSAPMVRALMDGRKTQTRRVLTPPYGTLEYLADGTWKPICTKFFPGDRLWVRETFTKGADESGGEPWPIYATDYDGKSDPAYRLLGPWSSPRFMPRRFSRITLTVTDVRVQRVQEISEADAWAEGLPSKEGDGIGYRWRGIGYYGANFDSAGQPTFHVPRRDGQPGCSCNAAGQSPAQCAFAELWDSLNAARSHGWAENPWVVALTFDVARRNIDQAEAA